MVTRTNSSISAGAAPDATSSIGTMSGGSLTILRSPSTTVVSFANAFMLSFDCALATLRSNCCRCFRLPCCPMSALMSSTSMREYQRSRFDMPANFLIASRYARVTARLTDCRCLASKPRSRPATAKLATSRLTSHSNGPGRVSSKSLMLNTSRRSDAAKAPKFDRCASPQSCTSSPVRGTSARSAAIGYAAPR